MALDLRRRDFITGLAAASAACLMSGGPGKAFAGQVTEYTGEGVEIPSRPRRLLLGDGHLLLALALVHPDPVSLLAGWQGDLIRHSPAIFDAYRKRSPDLAKVPVVGQASADSFSVEAAIATKPDLAILAGCYGPGKRTPQIVARLQAAGIPVLFVDFWVDPIRNTAPSIRALGQALGGESVDRAEAFADFHESRLTHISQRLKSVTTRPKVLIDMHPGAWSCCWVPGTAGFGHFISVAGGENVTASLSQLPWIQASREYVLSNEPDVFVATGGPYMRGQGGPVLGEGVGIEEARRTLKQAVDNSGLKTLKPVRDGRVSAFWHLFQDTPMNVVAVESLARAIHPDVFSDIDPAATMSEINRRFFAVPLEGCYTIAL